MGPKKQKSRAKKGPEVSDDDMLAIEKRTTRTQNARQSSRSTRTRDQSEDLEEDDGFVFTRKAKGEAVAKAATRGKTNSIEDERPATRGDKRKKAKDDEQTAAKKTNKRAKTTAASRNKRANSDQEEEEEDELITEPKARSNGSSKKTKMLLDEDDEEEVPPAPKRGRPKNATKDQPKATTRTKAKQTASKKKQEEEVVERPQRKTRSAAAQEEDDELVEPRKGKKAAAATAETDKPKRGGRKTKAQQQKKSEHVEDAAIEEEPKPKRGSRKTKAQTQKEEPPVEEPKRGNGRRNKKEDAPPSPPPEEEEEDEEELRPEKPRKTRQPTTNNKKKGTSTLASFETSSATKKASKTKAPSKAKGKSKLASFDSDESENEAEEQRNKALENVTTGSDDKAFQFDDVNEPNDHNINNDDNDDSNNNNNDEDEDGNNTPRTTSQEEVVSLPISDTPVIRRNQELRRKSGVRRSSLGNRGKRVSSIGNGFVAVPHDDVDPRDFYKHADSDIPDPHRMKQILLWCSKRVLNSQNERLKKLKERPKKSTADEATALTIARVIEDEIIRDLVQGKVSTSWWTRPEDPENDREVIKQPNSQNVTNAENLKAFEKRLQDLDNEKSQWAKLLESIQSREPIPPESVASMSSTSDTTEQVDKAVSEFQQVQQKYQTLEPTIDKLYDSIHKIQSISQASRMFHSNQMKELTSVLNQNTAASQSSRPPVRDILRTLTRLQPPPQS